MKRTVMQFFKMAGLSLMLLLTSILVHGQSNARASKREMKRSGSEFKHAGVSMAHNMKHGRVVRAGKHFGSHTGRAAKHLGRGTAKAIKHAIS